MLLGVATPSLAAETYPSHPVKLTVTYGKGGAADIAARLFAAIAPEYLGQPISVGTVIT